MKFTVSKTPRRIPITLENRFYTDSKHQETNFWRKGVECLLRSEKISWCRKTQEETLEVCKTHFQAENFSKGEEYTL